MQRANPAIMPPRNNMPDGKSSVMACSAGTLGKPWWREKPLLLVLLLAALFYSIRVTDLTIRGEESRRGRIAWEMWQNGDWIVPRIQGEPVFFRPPLQNWLIALIGAGRGQVDAWAVRLPSVAAVLLTVAFVYGYGRSFLSRFGAFFCALSLISLGQVLELGRLGETDALFMCFLAGSLLVWKWCQNRAAAPWVTWCTSYALAALATLTKGPQAPIYFFGSVAIFCLITGRRRQLLSRAHAAGLLTAVVIVGLWQIPYLLQMGFSQSIKLYFHDVGPRFNESTVASVAVHLVLYPLELLCGSLLPWSAWLVCLFSPQFRRHLRRWHDDVLYLVVCIAVTFPSVWFAPGASLRYYMPLFPCFACLVGIVIECFATQVDRDRWSTLICWYQRVLAALILCAGLGFVGVSLFQPGSSLAQPIPFAAFYCTLCVVVAVWMWGFSSLLTKRGIALSFTALACFLGVTQCSLMVNIRQQASEDPPRAIASMKEKIPPGQRLISLGPANHLFLFYLGENVPILDGDEAEFAAWEGTDYFCVWVRKNEELELEFPWERVATISCDRNRNPIPSDSMIIGRRTSNDLIATQISEKSAL